MGYNTGKRKNRHIILKIFLTIIILLSLFLIHYNFVSLPLIKSVAESKINKLVYEIVNNSASVVFAKSDYADFVTVEKNNNGEIEILKIDTIQINLLMQMLCFDAREQMNSKGKVITLPLGLFSGIAYFSEIGPGINISIESNESIHGELKSEFESVGINKTRHALYLNLYINTDIILPMSKKSIENTVSILVCENIFLGNIPENYIEFNN